MIKLLELYAGSRSVGKIAEELGMKVCSVDVKDFDGIHIVKDIEFLELKDLPFIPDIVWASPPCTTYSIAGIGHHRDMQNPTSEFAIKSDRLIKHTLKLIDEIIKINPGCNYYIENPVGMLRKMDFMQDLESRSTVTYCSYGDHRMKPTDIWNNNSWGMFNLKGWKVRPKCHNNNFYCHHDKSPRGTHNKGTQGLKGNYARSIIPKELCLEILENEKNNRG